MRLVTYESSGELTIAVPAWIASASTCSSGCVSLLSTSSEAPVSIARSCESGRSPTTTTSPRPTLLSDSADIACTHTRPRTSSSAEPHSSSPSSTLTIEPTGVGSSRREASRDSRM